MKIETGNFVDSRLEAIAANLRGTNGDYAKDVERRGELAENIGDIVRREKDIVLAECDRLDLREWFEKDAAIAAVERPAVYRQGLRDCVAILRCLGVLA